MSDRGLYEAVAFFFKHHPPVLPGVKPFEWCAKYDGYTGVVESRESGEPGNKASARKARRIKE